MRRPTPSTVLGEAFDRGLGGGSAEQRIAALRASLSALQETRQGPAPQGFAAERRAAFRSIDNQIAEQSRQSTSLNSAP